MLEKWASMTQEELQLMEKVIDDFGPLFDDMLFKPGTVTYDLTAVEAQINGKWEKVGLSLPEEMEYFTVDNITLKVSDLDGMEGYYDSGQKVLCVRSADDDVAIIHEMIHMYEDVVDSQPLFFHDMIIWALYKDLSKKVPDLARILDDAALLGEQERIYNTGGTHDILFLLKSIDLDIRQGYPLGTVFGYGKKLSTFLAEKVIHIPD